MRPAPAARATGAALLALACLAALTGCGRAGAAPGGKPTVVIGAKQFTEQWIIGEMYKKGLEKAGYDVELKSNIGSTEIIDSALTSGQIDLYPEYTGVILQVLAAQERIPHSAAATFREAKKFQEQRGHGLTMLDPTPFQNKNAVGVKPALAKKYGLKTIGDLRKVPKVRFAEYPDNIEGAVGYTEMAKRYGLTNTKVKSLNIGLQYTALDHGEVEAADVFTTDPQLAKGDYTLLEDDKGFYGFQNVAPVVHEDVLKEQGPGFAKVLNRIDGLLTEKAVQDLNRAVDTVRLTPGEVAERFLKANGLL
ncbi:hypothetical protein GCM10009801_04710 [Streptomyces albiaxialis]|uniref:ABC-type glycine betaine transport system substrate-binding domain-containing protein n=1 Tax=Streptomyces albiaxialis TaxID=329523 RepID=A0ABP5H0L5_9ACTN